MIKNHIESVICACEHNRDTLEKYLMLPHWTMELKIADLVQSARSLRIRGNIDMAIAKETNINITYERSQKHKNIGKFKMYNCFSAPLIGEPELYLSGLYFNEGTIDDPNFDDYLLSLFCLTSKTHYVASSFDYAFIILTNNHRQVFGFNPNEE